MNCMLLSMNSIFVHTQLLQRWSVVMDHISGFFEII